MKTRVVVVPRLAYGPKGDRDRGRYPYYDYDIHVIRDETEDWEPTKDNLVHRVCGFDHWWTTVKSHAITAEEARAYAHQLSKSLRADGVVWVKPPLNQRFDPPLKGLEKERALQRRGV